MKISKRNKARVMDLVSQFEYLFMVNGFERTLTFREKASPEDKVTADVDIDIPYQRMHINIYPHFWSFSRREQRKALLHEFCHILVNPIQNIATDLFNGKLRTEEERRRAVEESTSRIENLLDAQLTGRNQYAKIAYKKYLKGK